MAKIVGVFQAAHTPFCYRRPEDWNRARSGRPLRADVPLDDLESNRRKHARVQEGFAVLRRKLAEARPDVIVIFGDDQLECFDFTNYPAFSIYVGESFEGALTGEDAPIGGMPDPGPPKKVRPIPSMPSSVPSSSVTNSRVSLPIGSPTTRGLSAGVRKIRVLACVTFIVCPFLH